MVDRKLDKPFKAQKYDNLDELRADKTAGSFYINEYDGEFYFHYICPCGCGQYGCLTMGKGVKPPDSPSWQWDGNMAAPDLQPSLWHKWGPNKDHWHGWLRNGIWKDA